MNRLVCASLYFCSARLRLMMKQCGEHQAEGGTSASVMLSFPVEAFPFLRAPHNGDLPEGGNVAFLGL